MNTEKLFVGIDTSCYTTSLAASFDENIISLKKPLKVKAGECGLRQSEAFFQHSKNLPELFDELKRSVSFKNFKEVYITVSSRPRNIDGSYMPVFIAGQGYARSIASVLGAEYFESSHQEGHIMAALYSCKKYSITNKPFLTYHISGGTTELLLCKRIGSEFICEIVGGTLDLPAGQFIDRIGVKLGFDFPCGIYMDTAACDFDGEKPKVKTSVKGAYVNLSGEETRYSRMAEQVTENGLLAYCTMKCIADSLKKTILSAKESKKLRHFLDCSGI